MKWGLIIKKTILTILAVVLWVLGLTGCGKEISNSELEKLRTEIETKMQETDVINNVASVSIDYDKKIIVVELVDNSEEKQTEFKNNVNNSKYIAFQQGGPYTTSGLDFYITKPQYHNDIRFNDYYTVADRTIYLSGNLEEFYIKTQDREITLKIYLSTAFQTLDDGIKSVTDKLKLENTLKDGGTKIYKSKDKDITMIVCNTTKGDKNILIGDYSIEYTQGDCKN